MAHCKHAHEQALKLLHTVTPVHISCCKSIRWAAAHCHSGLLRNDCWWQQAVFALQHAQEPPHVMKGPSMSCKQLSEIWLQVRADVTPAFGTSTVRQATFWYSTDGSSYTQLGPSLGLTNAWEFFSGYRYAVFNHATKALMYFCLRSSASFAEQLL